MKIVEMELPPTLLIVEWQLDESAHGTKRFARACIVAEQGGTVMLSSIFAVQAVACGCHGSEADIAV